MIKSVLIANRGEIACRIIKTLKKLNIRSIAVYSEPDRNAKHVQLADEAHYIGQESLAESYLNIEKIIAIAKTTHADAIHPGYGFLSENARFAQTCQDENIIFIGPTPDAIQAMAVKDKALNIMQQADVPTTPGFYDLQSEDEFRTAAQQIGYPVLLKAAAGGGGKGMRQVMHESELKEALRQAKQESLKAFADDSMFVEKYLIHARHIEVQIFRDKHGNCVHLFERDCSTQRRHQKVIEEAPAINIPSKTLDALYETAKRAAQAINYIGAGTVEFLVSEQGDFYFMEMNTRLQVEHPVTELITGLDLVEWQILIADEKPLPLNQSEIHSHGHAIEARIYSEDPHQQFLPQVGQIKDILIPKQNGVRIDSGIQKGDHLQIYFDPMISKVIVWGKNREQALKRLNNALAHYEIVGIKNNIEFIRRISQSPKFRTGMDIQYLEKNLEEYLTPIEKVDFKNYALACLIQILHRHKSVSNTAMSPWDKANCFKINLPHSESINLKCQGHKTEFLVTHKLNSSYTEIKVEDPITQEHLTLLGFLQDTTLHYCLDNNWHQVLSYYDEHQIILLTEDDRFVFQTIALGEESEQTKTKLTNSITSPMPGFITKIWAEVGQKVRKGEKLVALEAMKMEHTVAAPKDGAIKTVNYQAGDQVIEGSLLLEFE